MPDVPKHLCETHSLGAATSEWLVSARQIPSFRSTLTRFAGYTEARDGYEFVRHQPAFSQILACTGGEGSVWVDGRWQPCLPGYAYVTAAHAACAYHVRPGRRWNVCWVLYEPAAQLPGIAPGQAPQLVPVDATGLQLAIEGLCHEAGGAGDPALVEFWAALTHHQVLRLLRPGQPDRRLDRVWQAVRHDLAGDWTLSRLARCAGMSEESLRRLSRQQVGRPPLAHVTYLRMLFAADLLGCSDEKIDSIAARVGYSDAFAFSNAFKRELGQPPSRYRTRQARGAWPRSSPLIPSPIANTPAPSAAVNKK